MKRSKSKGFTLVELMIVIAIIGIAAAALTGALGGSIANCDYGQSIEECQQYND
jgi:prepilin-type N-terminal cleavage/methylation domain-containing protein